MVSLDFLMGQTLYNISPEDEEVTISSESGQTKRTVLHPVKMLSFYEDGYTYNLDIEQNVKGRKIQYVKLTQLIQILK